MPIDSFKSSLIVQSHTYTTFGSLLFRCDLFRVLHAHQLLPRSSLNHIILGERFTLVPFVKSLIDDVLTTDTLHHFIGNTHPTSLLVRTIHHSKPSIGSLFRDLDNLYRLLSGSMIISTN